MCIQQRLLFVSLLLWFLSCSAGTISPWGNATIKSFDILTQNSGGLDFIIDGDTAYLAAEFQGLYVLDITNINDIKVKYHLLQSDFGVSGVSLYSIVKHGDFLYCGFRSTSSTRRGYIKVVNLINLETTRPIVEAGDIYFSDFTGQPTGLFLSAETQEIFVALRLGGIALIDIADPENPVMTGQFDPGLIEHQQVVVDREHNRAYFGSWFRGLGYVDISDIDPSSWTEDYIDDPDANDRYWYLVQKGNYLYVPLADSPSDNTFDEGLAVYDLIDNFSDPLKPPVRIGYAPIPQQFQCESAPGGKDVSLVGGDPAPHQIYLKDNYAILGNGCMGIVIFDITTPHNPKFIQKYEIPGQTDYPWSIGIKGNSLITVGRNKNFSVNNDVYVFDVSPVTFVFNDQAGAPLSNMIYSNIVTLGGLGATVEINISGGEYSINGGVFTTEPGLVIDGDTIQIRLISSSVNNTTAESKITIGEESDYFKVTTIPKSDVSIDDGGILSDKGSNGSLGLLELLLFVYGFSMKIIMRFMIIHKS